MVKTEEIPMIANYLKDLGLRIEHSYGKIVWFYKNVPLIYLFCKQNTNVFLGNSSHYIHSDIDFGLNLCMKDLNSYQDVLTWANTEVDKIKNFIIQYKKEQIDIRLSNMETDFND